MQCTVRRELRRHLQARALLPPPDASAKAGEKEAKVIQTNNKEKILIAKVALVSMI
jgi:hypothetical protein